MQGKEKNSFGKSTPNHDDDDDDNIFYPIGGADFGFPLIVTLPLKDNKPKEEKRDERRK